MCQRLPMFTGRGSKQWNLKPNNALELKKKQIENKLDKLKVFNKGMQQQTGCLLSQGTIVIKF